MFNRSSVAIAAGKLSRWALTTFTAGGSSLPGKIALSLDPSVLKAMARDYEVIIVSGTNGKTLTTSLLVNLLKSKYPNILTNPTGANLNQGIVSTFLSHKPKKGERKIAVLEVDEATIKHVTKYIQPKLFVFTNIFRDQMDRFGEIYTTYDLMLQGAAQAPQATILANGDLPIFHSKETVNPQKFFGFGHELGQPRLAHYNTDGVLCPHCQSVLQYKMITYANQGAYFCPKGDFERPVLDYQVTSLDDLSLAQSSFHIDGHAFTIPIGGLYNIYNALAAYAAASFMGMEASELQAGFDQVKRVFGRQEVFQVGDKQVMLNLIKNPVGFNQVVQLLSYEKEAFSLGILLNDRPADGQDVSWIWDGNFEDLVPLGAKQVTLGGIRVKDLTMRMTVAGFEDMKITQDNQAFIQAILDSPTHKVNILATYTALLDLRKDLAKAGYLKEGMNP